MNLDVEFPLDQSVIYLNHAAVAPWPKSTSEAVKQFADENCKTGAQNYLQWLKKERLLREQLRILINAPSIDDIALVKNTSEALSFVAYGLDWQPGDNIVSSNEEFPSNRVVWESLANQGVELRQANLASFSSPEEALFDLIDERTR
ncbi:MAG: aminotransferase, partial [Gammaproteobacteria bacterium]